MERILKTIKYIILGIIFLTPFIPLIVADSLFFPFITGKNFAFRVLIEIAFALWIILALYDKRYRPRRSWILIFFFLFLLSSALSTIFGANPYRSFWSNYERMEGLITYLHLFAYFLLLISMFRTERLWKWFFHTIMGVGVITAIYGILQLAGKLAIHQSTARLDATLGNASYLAIYMVFNAFLALYYLVKEKRWYRWFYLPLFFLFSFILYHTATRGAILGFVGGLLAAGIILALFSRQRRIRVVSFAGAAVIVLAVLGFLAVKNTDFVSSSPVLSRFAKISFNETTTQSRLVIWKMSWEGFKERPLLGWGPENYNLIFNKYYQPILYKQEPWFDRAHNVFFDRLTTGGILGLLLYLALFASAIYYLLLKRQNFKRAPVEAGIFSGLLAAYFFHNLFVFDNLVSFLVFFAVLAFIHNRSVGAEEVEAARGASEKTAAGYDGNKAILSSLVVVAFVFIFYFVNVPAFLACRTLLYAFRASAAGNAQLAFNNFQKAISYDSFGTAEAREHLTKFANKVLTSPFLGKEFKQEVFSYAAGQMRDQIERSPTDIRYMMFLANLYNRAGQPDKALPVLERALKLSPKKQMIYFELGSAYVNKKEYDKAEKVLKQAYDLEPSYAEAAKIYAVALIYNKKEREAEELLKKRFGSEILPEQRFVSAYLAAGDYERVVEVWKKIIEKNPNNAQYYVSLAATYLQIGQRDKAIESLEKAIELEPRFKEQGEYYINEIKAGRNP